MNLMNQSKNKRQIVSTLTTIILIFIITLTIAPIAVSAATPQVSAGVSHTVAIMSNGTLWAWGDNNEGQLGLGDTIDKHSPTQVGGTDWTSVSAGQYHTVAIMSNGTLWAWGYNANGQLGQESVSWDPFTSPIQVETDTDWTNVLAGDLYTVAIKSDGTLWAWGQNNKGQLGLENTTQMPSPTQVGSDTNWTSVSAGASHTVAIKSDGTLWAWGNNANGQLGLGFTSTYETSPIQVGTDTK